MFVAIILKASAYLISTFFSILSCYQKTYIMQSVNTSLSEKGNSLKIQHLATYLTILKEKKSMQRSETEAIRTQIQPSKPKREIINITNSKNGQSSEQLFPKRWPLRHQNRTKNNMNTPKVKRH